MPGKDRDEESGEYTTTYPDSDFLETIDQFDGMAGTNEIADEVGCSYMTAYERLQSLESEGAVDSRKTGNSILWIRSG
jgi:predicted ArsR family transcriptional regulator